MASRNVWGTLERFRTSKWGVILYYGYLAGILVAGVVATVSIRSNHALAVKANVAAAQANRSLCFQKRAAKGQLVSAREFLRDHPDGTGDFSRALIVNAIRTAEMDVAALTDVHCQPKGEAP